MIDLLGIASSTTKYNFHSHTQFCDGRAPMESFVIEAIKQGFTHYGFSPHSPVPFPSSANMSAEDVPLYLDEVARLKMKYQHQINLYASMEIDFVEGWGPTHPFFKSLPLDYRIGSVHFIPSFINPDEMVDIDGRYDNFKKKMTEYFNDDIEAVVCSYYDQSLKMIESGGFDIIAHCDKIGNNASCHRPGIDKEEWYDKLVLRNFEAIMDHNYVIEINTKAWDNFKRFFPNERYFKLIKQYNAPVVFNSDAHYPELINAGRSESIELFEKL